MRILVDYCENHWHPACELEDGDEDAYNEATIARR